MNTLAAIAARKPGFRSLGDMGRHYDRPRALTVLGGFAEFERELIRARTGEGRERRQSAGVRMGRKPKLTPHQIHEAVGRRDNGETVRDIARTIPLVG